MRSRSGFAAAVLLLATCGQGPTDPFGSAPDAVAVASAVAVDSGEPFRIRAGTIVRIEGSDLVIGFRGVSEDSRCPVDVVCVWQGDATARILAAVGRAAWTSFDLHTGVEPRSATFRDWKIELLSLEPEPRSDRRIPADGYTATLRITR